MMNLIQQLQQTPKWKKFEEWYEKQDFDIQMKYTFKDYWFEVLDFPFQKGVFEKFIESHGFEIHFDGSYNLYKSNKYIIIEDRLPHWISFEELLIWYFNN